MRLLIAGWQGQVARALVETAPAHPDVTALAVGRPALDLCSPASIASALSDGRPDVTINTAAYTAVDQAELEPEAAHKLNGVGAGLIATESARRGAVVIHLSTDYVFDGTSTEPYKPDDPTNPQSIYGHTKLAGEAAVRAANPRHIIVRTSWVHSPTGKNFVKTMLRIAEDRDVVRVVSDQSGSPTYAPHLADVLLAIAVRVAGEPVESDVWGTYHAAGSGATTWAGLAEAVFARSRQLGGPTAEVEHITTADYPTPATRPANSVLNCGKMERIFDLRLPDWREGVDACVSRLV